MLSTDFKIFDAHLHTYGVFLNPDENVLQYMDRFNVEKAIITTINRTKMPNKQKEVSSTRDEGVKLTDFMNDFRSRMPKGQLDHQDVIDIVNKAPERFVKFFWFNPMIHQDEEENSYDILKEHFKQGFKGVKIHSGFNMVKVPRDILKLASFMQDYDENLILYIHSLPKTTFFRGVSPKDIANLAKNFPRLRIIVGHAAFCMIYTFEVMLTLKTYENIYYETSCSVSFGIYNLIKTVGHERILFGSDSPTASSLPLEIDKILTLPRTSKEIKQDILYYNVAKLLNS